jgi:phosphoglycolate phosphatase
VLVRRTLEVARLDRDENEALTRFREIYDRRLLVHTTPYPGVPEMVRELAARARLAVLTNKPEAPARRLLEAFDLAPYLSSVVGGDSGFPRKPDPAGLRHLIAEAEDRAASAVLVGDSTIDVETARNAGVRVCFARYGFGHRRGAPDLRGDELVAETPADIVRLVG